MPRYTFHVLFKTYSYRFFSMFVEAKIPERLQTSQGLSSRPCGDTTTIHVLQLPTTVLTSSIASARMLADGPRRRHSRTHLERYAQYYNIYYRYIILYITRVRSATIKYARTADYRRPVNSHRVCVVNMYISHIYLYIILYTYRMRLCVMCIPKASVVT